jgi:hypothetical protein
MITNLRLTVVLGNSTTMLPCLIWTPVKSECPIEDFLFAFEPARDSLSTVAESAMWLRSCGNFAESDLLGLE